MVSELIKIRPMCELRQYEIDRFWSKVGITAQPNRCWEWQSSGGRYGYFTIGKGNYKANRVAYALHNKKDPGEMEVMHSCDNGLCCNPAHLSLGTHSDNMKDMVKKMRHRHRNNY